LVWKAIVIRLKVCRFFKIIVLSTDIRHSMSIQKCWKMFNNLQLC